MKKRVILLAGVVGVGLGLAVIAGRPDRPPSGTTVITDDASAFEGALMPLAAEGALTPIGPADLLIASSTNQRAEQTSAAAPSGAPAEYVYWEIGDPGVWGTPVPFSGSR